MKRFLILSLLVIGAMTLNAQKYIHTFPTDTVSAAEVIYYPSSSGLNTAESSTGAVLFTFTHTDLVDSLNYARIEWADNTTWTAMTSPAALVNTTTNGESTIYTSTPIIHSKYRVALYCAATDSVKITVPTLIYKNK